MVRHHHERIDGGGYPDGLAGSKIPLGARIIAVADTFDAITSSRAYRPAGTQKKALDVLSREAGSQLDGAAVAAFLHRYSARRSLALLSFAVAIPERIFAGLQAASSSLGVGAAGTTSILPALGAAGLLAFAPGLRHGTSVDRGAHRDPRSHAPAGRPFRRPQPPPRRGTPGGQGAFVRPHPSTAEAAEPCPPLPAQRRRGSEPRANRTPPRAAHARVRAKLPPARPRKAHRRAHHRPPRPPRKLRSRRPKLQRSPNCRSACRCHSPASPAFPCQSSNRHEASGGEPMSGIVACCATRYNGPMISPTDLYVLVGALSTEGKAWTLRDLAATLHVDHTLVHRALKRAENAGLYGVSARQVNLANFEELTIHAARFIAPARLGELTRGVAGGVGRGADLGDHPPGKRAPACLAQRTGNDTRPGPPATAPSRGGGEPGRAGARQAPIHRRLAASRGCPCPKGGRLGATRRPPPGRSAPPEHRVSTNLL